MIPKTSGSDTSDPNTFITTEVKPVYYTPNTFVAECIKTKIQGKFNVNTCKFHNNINIHTVLKEVYDYLIEKDKDVNIFIKNLFHIVYKNHRYYKVQCSINVDKFNSCRKKSIEEIADLAIQGVFNYVQIHNDTNLLSKKIDTLDCMEELNADMIKLIDNYNITFMKNRPGIFILYLSYLYRFELNRRINNIEEKDSFEIDCFKMFCNENISKIEELFLLHDLFNINLRL